MSGTATSPGTQERSAPRASERRRRAHRRRRSFGRGLLLAVLVLLAVVMLSPFAIIALNAFKSAADYASNGPLAFPNPLHLDGLIEFWSRVDFGRKLWNSALISVSVAVGAVVLSILNAYALGIGRVRGRVLLLVVFLMANIVPHEALAYPLYYAARTLGIYDTRLAVIIIFTVIQSAFGTYLLSSVLSAFPREIIEAARIDGASRWQVLRHVVVPVSRPTVSVLFVFFFIWTWNEFFLPLIFLISNDNQTVPVALGVLSGQRMMDVTTSSASGLLGVLPAVLFFLLFQRTLTRGIAAGAVK